MHGGDAGFPPAPRSRSSGEREQPSRVFPVRVDDRLAVGARLLEPVGGKLRADLLQAVLERGARRLHLHALGGDLLEVPLGLVFPTFQPCASATFAILTIASCAGLSRASNAALLMIVRLYGIHAFAS